MRPLAACLCFALFLAVLGPSKAQSACSEWRLGDAGGPVQRIVACALAPSSTPPRSGPHGPLQQHRNRLLCAQSAWITRLQARPSAPA